MADPITGTTICSCQMKTGTHAYLSRMAGLQEAVYSGASQLFQSSALLGADASAFYPMTGLKTDRQSEGMKAAPPAGPPPYYLEQLMAAHPYNAFYPGLDLNNARRKNATRETTSALKAWLYEHRKNPYPTKGEKIMLAIITRMTLTQVSTWFANARRRLKKENKLDSKDDDDLCDIDVDDKQGGMSESSRVSVSDEDERLRISSDLSDISDAEDGRVSVREQCAQRLFSPDVRTDLIVDKTLSPETLRAGPSVLPPSLQYPSKNDTDLKGEIPRDIQNRERTAHVPAPAAATGKPKIWSISEIISSNS